MVISPDFVPTGEVTLRCEFEIHESEKLSEPDFKEGKGYLGRSRLYINGKLVASKDLLTQ